jgi:tetratricopeptide (TPR) repeat protein
MHPLIILSILSALWVLIYRRTDPAGQFILGTLLVPLLLLYNPATMFILHRAITAAQIWRVRWLFPVALAVGLLLYHGLQRLQSYVPGHSFQSRKWRYTEYLPLIMLGVLTLFLSGPIRKGLMSIQREQQRLNLTVSAEQRDFLEQVDHAIPPGSVVLADTLMGRYLPAFSANSELLFFRSWSVDDTIVPQVVALFRADVIDNEAIDLLKAYGVRYVAVPIVAPLFRAMDAEPGLFRQVAGNDAYTLYGVTVDGSRSPVIAGDIARLKGDYLSAIDNYQAALEVTPQDPIAYLGMIKIHLARTMFAEAAFAYQTAMLYAGKDLPAYPALIEMFPDLLTQPEMREILATQPTLSKVVEFHENRIASDPHDLQNHEALAAVYRNLEDPQRFVEVYEHALQYFPSEPAVYINLGKGYGSIGRMDAAIESFTTLIAMLPNAQAGHQGLAALYENQGFLQEAYTTYEMAMQANPTAAWPRLELGKMYLNLDSMTEFEAAQTEPQRQVQSGLTDYQVLLSANPTDAQTYLQLGDIYQLQGQISQTVTLYQKAIEYNPGQGWPHLQLGQLYLSQANTAE